MTTVLENLFHGTNARFKEFRLEKARMPKGDHYGGGIYATDSLDSARVYAVSMVKQYGGERIIYRLQATVQKTFDVDHKFTSHELISVLNSNPKLSSETFARGAHLLPSGVDKYGILVSLEGGKLILSGDDVFKGLSFGGVNNLAARDALLHLGYDSLRYNGGRYLGLPHHNVFIFFHPKSQLKIVSTIAPKLKTEGTVPRDYKKEYNEYHSSPKQKKNRALRNAARSLLASKGRVSKGDGKDVDHKRMLIKGGSNSSSNLRVQSAHKNRGWNISHE